MKKLLLITLLLTGATAVDARDRIGEEPQHGCHLDFADWHCSPSPAGWANSTGPLLSENTVATSRHLKAYANSCPGCHAVSEDNENILLDLADSGGLTGNRPPSPMAPRGTSGLGCHYDFDDVHHCPPAGGWPGGDPHPLNVGDPAYTTAGEVFASVTNRTLCAPRADNWPDCNVIRLEITDEYAGQMQASTTNLVDVLVGLVTFVPNVYAGEFDPIAQGGRVYDAAGRHYGYITGIKDNVVEVCYSEEYAEWMAKQQPRPVASLQ